MFRIMGIDPSWHKRQHREEAGKMVEYEASSMRLMHGSAVNAGNLDPT